MRVPPEDKAVSRRALLRIPRTGPAAEDIDFEGATERVRRGWELEGHATLLRALEPVADVVAELAEIGPGQDVLDVGAGDGNLALVAAARGAEVDACDLAMGMVERGHARSAVTPHEIAWRVGDVQALPYADDSFDRVVSSFGAVLAPRPNRTARELARVALPGGVVALTAWIPRGLPGGLEELVEPLAPRPNGVPRVAGWGIEDVARRRLGAVLSAVELRMRTVALRFASPEEAFGALVRPYDLDALAREALRPQFERLLASCNNKPTTVEIDARYLVAFGRVPE